MDQVDLVLDHLDKPDTFVQSEASFDELVAADADGDGIAPSHPLANPVQNHDREPGPVFQTAAVFVGAMVPQRA